jgi:hypothetical protein
MELHLKLIGVILIVLAFVHVIFPRYFNWKTELKSLSLINNQMMYVHTFFVAIVVFLMGILCIYCTSDIIYTKLGKQLSFGLFVFWGLRLIFQFFVYSSKLWKGKMLETVIHIIFSILWIYFTTVFLIIFLSEQAIAF